MERKKGRREGGKKEGKEGTRKGGRGRGKEIGPEKNMRKRK